MTGRYVSAHPLPTDHEREILIILIEECGEVIQAATKLLRFGAQDGYPGSMSTNSQSLGMEIGELLHMVEMAETAGLIHEDSYKLGKRRKRDKVARYMQTANKSDHETLSAKLSST